MRGWTGQLDWITEMLDVIWAKGLFDRRRGERASSTRGRERLWAVLVEQRSLSSVLLRGTGFVVNEIVKIAQAIMFTRDGGNASWGEFLCTPGNRKRRVTILLVSTGTQWFGLSVIS